MAGFCRHLQLTHQSFLCTDGSADSDGEAAASTAMLTVMPIVVVPCLVGGYWLPKLLTRKELLIEWVGDKHGKGTAVMLKSDERRGVCSWRHGGAIDVRFAADGSTDRGITTDAVLAVQAGSRAWWQLSALARRQQRAKAMRDAQKWSRIKAKRAAARRLDSEAQQMLAVGRKDYADGPPQRL